MRHYLTLANLLTLGSLTAGFLAALRVFEADLLGAAGLVALAALLDTVDGVAARRGSGGASEFGASLDSLADLISFGMVPTLAVYLNLFSTMEHPLRATGLAVCTLFVLCSALRLARFSVTKHLRCFVGLPTPPAGLALVALPAFGAPVLLALCVCGALCVLMVSTIRVPTLHGLAELFGKNREEEKPETDGTEEEARAW